MDTFNSKIDIWLLIVLGISIIACLFAVYTTRDYPNWSVPAITFILGVGLPIWILGSTKYVISGDELLVKSGPFSWNISISSITAVIPTRNPLSSPALSLDRLEIRYGDKSIMVSPADKKRFSAAIGYPQH